MVCSLLATAYIIHKYIPLLRGMVGNCKKQCLDELKPCPNEFEVVYGVFDLTTDHELKIILMKVTVKALPLVPIILLTRFKFLVIR